MFSLFTFINTQKSRIGINWASTLKRVLSHLPLFSQVFDIHQGGYFSAKVPTPSWASSELRKPRQYWRNHEGFPKSLKKNILKKNIVLRIFSSFMVVFLGTLMLFILFCLLNLKYVWKESLHIPLSLFLNLPYFQLPDSFGLKYLSPSPISFKIILDLPPSTKIHKDLPSKTHFSPD